VQLPEATVSTGAGIGIALARPDGTKDDLLRHADTAMYAAKASGAACVVYDETLDHGRAERLSLLADLHQALEDDDLTLHYQPKFDLAFGVVTSVEALVRWTHPRLGPMSPDTFVPLAESTGLIEPFTRSVLAMALRQCRAWMDQGTEVSVAVNLSARNVSNPDLPEEVAAALALAGVPAHRLILEITESSVMGDAEHTVPILERLVAIGVTLSLDDFGTGYSSLSYLQRLPVRELKIDRSFVVGLEAGSSAETVETSEALIRSITGLKRSLGLRIVAEGVEDETSMERLRALGCDLIQGYWISRPAPAAQLEAHLPRFAHVEP
jgi:EAL domain-containing protein (putative c-di-GMP-specific phosphodiesterase class I)